jgi:lipopolysaccharide transport system permease protein
MFWSFLNPVLMLAVYTFVFGIAFNARWNQAGSSKTEFALILFAGLIIFNVFAECVTRAPSLVLLNVNYVKKVVFPLEILAWAAFGSAVFHLRVSLGVWLIFYAALYGLPNPTVALFPLVILPLALLILGVSWFLASLGVYLRDVTQFVGIAVTIMMFLSPIFYPLESIPAEFQPLLLMNPLTLAVEQARDLLVWGRIPDLSTYLGYLVECAIVAELGFAWFQKTRTGFADVL